MPTIYIYEDATAPYGYCPRCGAPGHSRERRPNGNDTCEQGHTYPTNTATKRKKT